MTRKFRADALVAAQGLAASADQAARLIMAGKIATVDADGRLFPVSKPGQTLAGDARFALIGVQRFVSRGGYKLLTAIEHFKLEVRDRICLDVGASTGGFTDCLLQHGAARVYAVDVGRAQLHEHLRADSRVISLEGISVRLAPPDLIPEPVSLIVADVSFISLTRVLPFCLHWLDPDGEVVALIKPQFELGAHQIGRGVVRDPALRQLAVDTVVAACSESLELECLGVVAAAVKGPKGNQEYLARFVPRHAAHSRHGGLRPDDRNENWDLSHRDN